MLLEIDTDIRIRTCKQRVEYEHLAEKMAQVLGVLCYSLKLKIH